MTATEMIMAVVVAAAVAVAGELLLIWICMRDILLRRVFRFFDARIWRFLVLFGSVVGQAAYYICEMRPSN